MLLLYFSMAALRISTSFNPLRINAFINNSVALYLEVENASEETLWVEAQLEVPAALSLMPGGDVARAKTHLGILGPGEIKNKEIKVYAGAKTYPETYPIKLMLFGYDRNAVIFSREEHEAELRCERIGR